MKTAGGKLFFIFKVSQTDRLDVDRDVIRSRRVSPQFELEVIPRPQVDINFLEVFLEELSPHWEEMFVTPVVVILQVERRET